MAERKTVKAARAQIEFWMSNLQSHIDLYWERAGDPSKADGQPAAFWKERAQINERDRDLLGDVLELLP